VLIGHTEIIYDLTKVNQNLSNIQKQIDSLQQCYQNVAVANNEQKQQNAKIEKIMLENLVITKQTYKTTQRFFGKNLSDQEQEMGSFLPLISQSDIDCLEGRLKNEKDNDAMVSTKYFDKIDVLRLYVISENIPHKSKRESKR